MGNQPALPGPNNGGIGVLEELIKRLRLSWLLFTDNRVPFWTKLVPLISVIYLVSPIDFIPEAIFGPPGYMDDLGIILLGLALFVKLSPFEIVEAYKDELLFGSQDNDDDDVVDANYRIIKDQD